MSQSSKNGIKSVPLEVCRDNGRDDQKRDNPVLNATSGHPIVVATACTIILSSVEKKENDFGFILASSVDKLLMELIF
jgi:hypothetical protein